MNALMPFERLDDLFPEMFRRYMRPLQANAEGLGDIRIDVTENDKDYSVRAEIPGARKDDIRVSVDGNRVSIAAEVRKDKEDKDAGGRVLLKETTYGSVSRTFTVAHDIDNAGATAKLEDGVLKLTLPKLKGERSRLLSIG